MKKFNLFLLILIISISISGCFKRDDLEDITVYATIYPIKYLTEELYGYNSVVKSIYPKGIDVKNYPISDKKITDYAKESSLFVYNGLSNEKDMAANFLKNNKEIRIIDVSQGLKIKYDIEELWLSPTNYLMLALNIKNGLKEYIDNQYIHQEIEENYNNLKTNISKIEAELKVIAENSKNKTIVIANDSLLFLTRYGYDVISIDNRFNEPNQESIARVKKLISEKKLEYIFKLENYPESELLRDLTVNTKVEIINLGVIINLAENDDETTINYLTVMQENVEKIKNALYE